ncbi:MAG: carboxypeptidase regulatory-like domain-containing protein [Acidobacteria bacterium]|nr:carboxypeptidase regulatory-like domain-containing protein [Acidobacteriota bacterium]
MFRPLHNSAVEFDCTEHWGIPSNEHYFLPHCNNHKNNAKCAKLNAFNNKYSFIDKIFALRLEGFKLKNLRPKYLCLFIGISFLLLTGNFQTPAQSPDDGFNPNIDIVNSIAKQTDGKIVVGGSFLTVNGQSQRMVARFNVDGSLDSSFINPNVLQVVNKLLILPGGKFFIGTIGGGKILNADGSDDNSVSLGFNNTVNTAILQSDGKLIVGGSFTTAGGQTRNGLARFNTDLSLDTSFNPNVTGNVNAVAIQSDGKILIGGGFSAVAGQTRGNFAKLNADGTLDSLNLAAGSFVNAIEIQSDGKILVGGGFATFGGQTRFRIARINANNSLDTSFNPNAQSGGINTIAIQSDGKILIGGSFLTVGGQTFSYFARLNMNGSPDTNFSLVMSATAPGIKSIFPENDGNILVGGDFSAVNGQGTGGLARFHKDGSLNTTFDPNANSTVFTTATQKDGKILLGGDFTTIGGQSKARLARLNFDNTLDTAFDPSADESVLSMVVQPDGKFLIGGDFLNVNGQSRSHLARLNGDGSLDNTFNPNADNSIRGIKLQTDGKIIIVGDFLNVNGVARARIARLNADGSLDTAVNPSADNTVNSAAIQNDGKILIGGNFAVVNGQTRTRLARLNTDLSLDNTFNPNADNTVYSISLYNDGRILVGGDFLNVNGQSHFRLARLNSDGSLDTSFGPGLNDTVLTTSIQADGKIFLGGAFTRINANDRLRFARLNDDGTLDAFRCDTNSTVLSTNILPDGKILISGDFTIVEGVTRNRLARITNDTPVSQSMNVNAGGITLTRDGGGLMFNRVTFEKSTDNGTNWTMLGNGTPSLANLDKRNSILSPAASTYGITGVSIPSGQNVLIRATGYGQSGLQGGSQTAEEFVQNVYLLAPTAANVSISGRVFANDGRGLQNAVISLTDSKGNTRTTRTSSFGYYRFEELTVGETVVLSINSKGFRYEPKVVTVNESLTDYDFIPINFAQKYLK